MPDILTGLAGHWKLDEVSGNLADVSGNGFTMTVTGTPTYSVASKGGLGTSITFDGSTNYALRAAATAALKNCAGITLSCWFKTTTTTQSCLFSFEKGGYGDHRAAIFMLGGASAGKLFCIGRSGDAEARQDKLTTGTYNDGVLHHAVAVLDFVADTITIYVDGVAVGATGAISFTAAASSNTDVPRAGIGGTYVGAEPFAGTLDDMRAYARALPLDDVVALYHVGKPTNSVAPVVTNNANPGVYTSGSTLNGTTGTWSDGTTVRQWLRCDSLVDSTNEFALDQGINTSTYLVTNADKGYHIRERVISTNSIGSTTAYSDYVTISGSQRVDLVTNKKAHFKLDEVSGTVAENQIGLDTDVLGGIGEFDGGSSAGTYGDVPTGWTSYEGSLSDPLEQLTEVDDASDTLTITNKRIGASTKLGVLKGGAVTSGVPYKVTFRHRFLANNGASNANRLRWFTDTWNTVGVSGSAAVIGEWVETTAYFIPTGTTFYLALWSEGSEGEGSTVEVSDVHLYQTNYGTYARDASLTTVPGALPVGTGYGANGTSDYVNVPSAGGDVTGTAFTAHGWIKPDVSAGSLLVKYQSYTVQIVSNKLAVTLQGVYGGYKYSTATIPVGVATEFAVTFDGLNLRIYLNGVLDSTHSAPGSIVYSVNPLYLLCTNPVTGFFDGMIDDVQIFARALTAAEVAELYSSSLRAPHSGSVVGLAYTGFEYLGVHI